MYAYLSREILFSGLSFAYVLDEFHPDPMVYSSVVESLVRPPSGDRVGAVPI